MFLKGTHRAAGNGQGGRFPSRLFVRATQTCGGEPRHQGCVQAKALGRAAAEGLLVWQVWCCVTRATKGCDSCRVWGRARTELEGQSSLPLDGEGLREGSLRLWGLLGERTLCSVEHLLSTDCVPGRALAYSQWGQGGHRGPLCHSLLCPALSRNQHTAP